MSKHTDITNELNQIAPGVNWPADAPFTAPAGYFEQLPAAILLQLRLQELRSGSAAAHLHPAKVPPGYFESLPEAVMERIKAAETNPVRAELAAVSPFLAAIPPQTPFTVPDGYFESLEINRPALKVAYRNRKRAWIKWTAAACLVALIGGNALVFFANNNNHNNTIEKQLEALNEQDIVNYLQTHTDPLDIEAYFAASVETTPVQSQLNDAVPLEAVEKYLQQTDLKELLPDTK
jgi:hypothetical protein